MEMYYIVTFAMSVLLLSFLRIFGKDTIKENEIVSEVTICYANVRDSLSKFIDKPKL